MDSWPSILDGRGDSGQVGHKVRPWFPPPGLEGPKPVAPGQTRAPSQGPSLALLPVRPALGPLSRSSRGSWQSTDLTVPLPVVEPAAV